MKYVTLISESGNLKVTKEQAEKMLRIQRNMRGRAYTLPNNLELVNGEIIKRGDRKDSRKEAEQETA